MITSERCAPKACSCSTVTSWSRLGKMTAPVAVSQRWSVSGGFLDVREPFLSSAVSWCVSTSGLLVDSVTTSPVAGIDMCATPMTQPRKKWSVASNQWLESVDLCVGRFVLITSHWPLATALRLAITVAGAVVRRPSRQGSSQHSHVVGLVISDVKGRPTQPGSPITRRCCA